MKLMTIVAMAAVLMAGSAVMAQNLPKEATGANPAIFNEPADFT